MDIAGGFHCLEIAKAAKSYVGFYVDDVVMYWVGPRWTRRSWCGGYAGYVPCNGC